MIPAQVAATIAAGLVGLAVGMCLGGAAVAWSIERARPQPAAPRTKNGNATA